MDVTPQTEVLSANEQSAEVAAETQQTIKTHSLCFKRTLLKETLPLNE